MGTSGKRIDLAALRRFAIARSLFAPVTLPLAISRLAFVQADPIRAPARAQDLTLRHRVAGYRAGDLERAYAALAIDEDTFINYGFMPAAVRALMQPRPGLRGWSRAERRKADLLLNFVAERGEVHPREVDAHFSHGAVTNYWGGSSNATTHMLEHLHYGGLLRVARRERGIRIYGATALPAPPDRAGRQRQIDALVDVVVNLYAPLPARSLSAAIARLRYAVPQWRLEIKSASKRAHDRLAYARVDHVDWYWPANESPHDADVAGTLRLLAPFDPVVWDRRRFELLWGWAYRFEAYTPAAKRKLGYYALPMLWRDRVVGWSNVGVRDDELVVDCGYVAGVPRDHGFRRELDLEVDRLRAFLGLR